MKEGYLGYIFMLFMLIADLKGFKK